MIFLYLSNLARLLNFILKFLPLSLRLGVHVAIFDATFCRRFCSEWRRFFASCTRCDFSARLCWWFRGGGKIELIKIHFLSWIPFFRADCARSSIWSWLFYSQHLLTLLWFYVDKLSVFRKNVRRQNRSGAHRRSLIYFNTICFFCGIVPNTCGKKSQHVAPVWFVMFKNTNFHLK